MKDWEKKFVVKDRENQNDGDFELTYLFVSYTAKHFKGRCDKAREDIEKYGYSSCEGEV